MLKQIHGTLVAAVDKIMRMEPLESKALLEEVMTEECAKLFKLKEEVIQWMAVQARFTKRRVTSYELRVNFETASYKLNRLKLRVAIYKLRVEFLKRRVNYESNFEPMS